MTTMTRDEALALLEKHGYRETAPNTYISRDGHNIMTVVNAGKGRVKFGGEVTAAGRRAVRAERRRIYTDAGI